MITSRDSHLAHDIALVIAWGVGEGVNGALSAPRATLRPHPLAQAIAAVFTAKATQ